jgi:hypothetical protein
MRGHISQEHYELPMASVVPRYDGWAARGADDAVGGTLLSDGGFEDDHERYFDALSSESSSDGSVRSTSSMDDSTGSAISTFQDGSWRPDLMANVPLEATDDELQDAILQRDLKTAGAA